MIDLKQHIAAVPDFPRPGILFRDIAPLLARHFTETIDALDALLSASEWESVDVVGGIDSRGFILAAALAARRGKGFIAIRKGGKLPPPVVSRSYTLEYGAGVLEMHRGSGRILIVDDVLATGGTLTAAADLCELAGYTVAHLTVLIDLGITADYQWMGQLARSTIQYR